MTPKIYYGSAPARGTTLVNLECETLTEKTKNRCYRTTPSFFKILDPALT